MIPTTFDTAFFRYERAAAIGEGGAGIVFEARRSDGVLVAAKLLKPHAAHSDKLSRFRNEIVFCSAERHPNIVRVLDQGFASLEGVKCPFYIMPLCHSTLRRQMGTLQPAARLPLYAKILDGVEAAHLLHVWHRDLKPENILIDNAGMSPVVADFGIAHFHEDLVATAIDTAPHQRLANFQYAAPEQRTPGMAVDHRADIYALGLILNELFTGQIPLGTGYRRIETDSPAFAYLDSVVELMIRQGPKDRPATLQEVKALLIGHRNQFVSRQRLSDLTHAVVPVEHVDDPLVATPIRIVGADYREGWLSLTLQPAPNGQWQHAFSHINYRTALMGNTPGEYRFRDNVMATAVSSEYVQRVVDDSKRFVQLANEDYAEKLRQRAARREEEERSQLIREREIEEERLRVLKTIRL